jgi:hypothetical protein
MYILFLLITVSCLNQEKDQLNCSKICPEKITESVIADTIIYDVVLKNFDETDLWKETCLSQYNNKEMIRLLMKGIKEEKLTAFSFPFDKKIETDSILSVFEELESDSNFIGKIQFQEKWSIDTSNFEMTKEVEEYVLGYSKTDNDGRFKGYSAIARIRRNAN